MGFFSKRSKTSPDPSTSDVDAWMRTADEASEHDALDMVDVDEALGGLTPAPPAPPAPPTPSLETFDPSSVANQFRRADDDGSMWHFPELETGDLDGGEPPTPEGDRRAAIAEPSDVPAAPSMFEMLSEVPPRPEVEARREVETPPPVAEEPDPLGHVALTMGGEIEDVWATFDSLSPAPDSSELDGLWGKKERRRHAEAAPAPAAPSADPFAPIDHLLPELEAARPATAETTETTESTESTETTDQIDPGSAPELDAAAFTPFEFEMVENHMVETEPFEILDFGVPGDCQEAESGPAADTDLAAPAAWQTLQTPPTEPEAPTQPEALTDPLPAAAATYEIDPVYGPLPVPDTDQTRVLLEILGLQPGVDWSQVRGSRTELVAAHDPNEEIDLERSTLATEIRGEINTAYAALRLLYVA